MSSVVLASLVAFAAAGCGGGSGKSAGASPSTTPSTFPLAITTTTVKATPATPADFARNACIDFNSLDGFLQAGGDAGGNVAGEIGGAIQEVGVAVNDSRGGAQWVKLQKDLEALQSLAMSKTWPETPAAAQLPQTLTVVADCKAVIG